LKALEGAKGTPIKFDVSKGRASTLAKHNPTPFTSQGTPTKVKAPKANTKTPSKGKTLDASKGTPIKDKVPQKSKQSLTKEKVPSNNNGSPTKGKVDGRRGIICKDKGNKKSEVKRPLLNDLTKLGF